MCYASLVYRIVGGIKGQLVDNDERKSIARNIDAFPETLEAEEHRPLLFTEAARQFEARHVALLEKREGQVRRHQFIGAVEHALAGKEQKSTPMRELDQFVHLAGNGLHIVI